MNYEDTSEQHDRRDGRGRSEGSRRNHFSKHKQPSRRGRRKARVHMKDDLLEQLHKPIVVTVDGRRKTMTVLQVLFQSLVQDALKGSVNDKLRFLERLEKLGISAVQSAWDRLEEERREFDEERRRFVELKNVNEILLSGATADAAAAQAKWYRAAKALQEVTSECTCGASKTIECDDIAWLLREFQDDQESEREVEEFARLLKQHSMRTPPYDRWDDDRQDIDDDERDAWGDDRGNESDPGEER